MSENVPMTVNVDALPQDFFRCYWQKRPILLPAHVKKFCKATDWIARARSWSRRPATARLFVLRDEVAPGLSQAARISSPSKGYRLFKSYAESGDALTLLLNRVETVAPEIAELRAGLGVGRHWRYDDIVATLSTKGSGIGFHAGHEDGFVVQLSGARNWLVWRPSVIPLDYRRSLVGDRRYRVVSAPPRSAAPPDYEFTLTAGDALYLPALFGHEGRTLELSVSLSIGWRGLNAWRLITEALGSVDTSSLSELEYGRLFDLINDPAEESPALEHYLKAVFRLTKKMGLSPAHMLCIEKCLAMRFLPGAAN
jgi:50S ribosomal protein L16 3-hydroxylase